MRARRRFTADFKARVALEALRGDKCIQEISTRHKVHPNQVSTWKRQAMDGRGRCMDNIFIERLWRSLKYEAVYLHELTDGFVAERVIGEWFNFYNTERPHSSCDGQTPAETYGAMRPVGKWTTGCAGLTASPQVSPVAVSGIPREAKQQQQDMINRVLAT